MPVTAEMISGFVGREVQDEYGRSVGVLVSFYSSVDGTVEAIEVKIADRGVEKIEAARVRVSDGKLVVTPAWKHRAVRVIEALDRAYRRRKAIETLEGEDIPSDVISSFKIKLADEIKKLKKEAEEAKSAIKSRLHSIEDESLHLARALTSLKMLYFSGEVPESNYTQSVNQLRRLRESLAKEREDAKKVMEKLEKTLQAATSDVQAGKPAAVSRPVVPAAQTPSVPGKTGGALVVHVEEG
ncbi:MAG: CdvA-like protein [Desulfurococcales archaeon]|nr:CdvA-like protein [Desulfurococcales archaeon]